MTFDDPHLNLDGPLELPHHTRSSCRSWFPLEDKKGCCSKPTPAKPTLSVQCIDIWYIYSIYTVYTHVKEKATSRETYHISEYVLKSQEDIIYH